MSTIVRCKKTDRKYVLLGTGFGARKSLKPHYFFGDSVAETDSDHVALVAVINSEGDIGWCAPDDLTVVSIDGTAPAELL